MTTTLSIYSVLKNLVGKDVTKVAMPVHLNEPLSFTQVWLAILSIQLLWFYSSSWTYAFMLVFLLVNMFCLGIVLAKK